MSEPEENRVSDEDREQLKRMIREGLEQRRQEREQQEMQRHGGCLGFLFGRGRRKLSEEEKRDQLKQLLHDRLERMPEDSRETALEMLGDAADAAKRADPGQARSALLDSFVDRSAGMLGEAREALRQLVESRVSDRVNAPSLECPLRPIDSVDWLSEKPFADWTAAIQASGFKAIGTFERPDHQCEVAAFAHAELHCGASMYSSPAIQILEFFAMSKDGALREVSNYAPAQFVAVPDWFEMRVESSGDERAQWDRFLSGHHVEASAPIEAESYIDISRDIHRRLTAWNIERGGAAKDELYRQMEVGGHLPEDPDECEAFMDVVRRNEAERHLSAWWKLQDDAPCSLDRVMESLVIIHDDLTPDLLLQDYWRISENYRFKERDLPDLPPREAWAKLMKDLENPMTKVLEKRTGFPADYYLPAD